MPLGRIRKSLTFSSIVTNTEVLFSKKMRVLNTVHQLYLNKKKKKRLYKLARLKYSLQLVKLVHFIILENNVCDLTTEKTFKKIKLTALILPLHWPKHS